MKRTVAKTGWRRIGTGMMVLALAVSCAIAAGPKRVLILNPYGHDVAPFATAVSAFRSTLVRELGEPVDFHEVPLDLARIEEPGGEGALVTFLEGRLNKRPVDLVAPLGGAGVQFAARHRERLFPNTPMVLLAGEPRLIPAGFARTDAAVVTHKVDLPGMVEDILQLQPQTTHIAVVFGASAIEEFWVNECRREFASFTNRVGFTWLNELPLEQILQRCATLPPRSFILHVLFVVDAAGNPCEQNEALLRLHQVANAPLFGYFASELGLGPVGGRLYDDARVGAEGARVAIRILRGESPDSIPPQVFEAGAPVYDWRELRRWGISEAGLPPGSVVEFRQRGFWETNRWLIVGATAFCVFQAALIVGLWLNRARWIRGEAEAVLIADISSKFVNLPVSEVDREIVDALRRICDLLDLDLAALWQWWDDAPGALTLSHFYLAGEGPKPPEGMNAKENFPWLQQEMLAGRIAIIPSVDDMPPEAACDREVLAQFGVKSNLTIPLTVGGEPPIGALGFNVTRGRRGWPEPLIKRLQLVAEIFTNALARKLADQALRESELRLSVAADSAEAGLWVLDFRTRRFWTTERARAIFGYSRDEVISMERFRASVHPDDRDLVEGCIDRAVREGDAVNVEYRIVLPDGRERWIISRGRPQARANGAPDRLVGLSMDITDRKRMEGEVARQQEELAHVTRVTTMGQLTSALAHELNQPLGAILRNAEAAELFLQEECPQLDEVKAILGDIRRDDQRAGEVIDRVRALVKRRDVEQAPVALDRLAEDVFALLRSDAERRRVRMTTEVGSVLPVVLGDGVQLQQVLLNLLLNAMDAVGENPPADRLVALRIRRAGASVELTVRDNGPGIPAEKLSRLFEPFFSSKPNGLGMGLAISRGIVEAHRGRLWASNAPGGGAEFTVALPAADGGPAK